MTARQGEKNMKKNIPIKDIALTFNAHYADIQAAAKLVRDELKKNLSFVKKLSKKAHKLYHYGDDKCFTSTEEHGCRPIDGIKNLSVKMDNLDWLINADLELDDLIKDFGEI